MLFPITEKPVPSDIALEDGNAWTHLELHLFYRRIGRCLDLVIEAVQHRDDGDGWTVTCAYGSAREHHTYQVGWRRDNHKRKQKIAAEFKAQIAAKSGYAWDLVSAYCAKNGFTLSEVNNLKHETIKAMQL